MPGAGQSYAQSKLILEFCGPLGLQKFDIIFQKKITHYVILCASLISKLMNIKGNLMICAKNEPAYPIIFNVKFTTSVKNAEYKNRVSLFKQLKINSLMENK